MEYAIKCLINNVEITEENADNKPYISACQLKQSTSLTGIPIGDVASDSLYLTVENPSESSYDGAEIKFYISPQEDTSSTLGDLEDEVGTETTDTSISEDDLETLEEDTEEGEDLTEDELTELETEQTTETTTTYEFFEGENTTETFEITDIEEEEWEYIGTYYVNSESRGTDNSVNLVAYDVVSKLIDKYVPTITSGTVLEYYTDITTQINSTYGITCEEEVFSDDLNITITWNLDCTLREAIGYIAGLVGGYVGYFENTLGIDYCVYNDSIILDSEVYDYSETSAGQFQLGGLICYLSTVGDTSVAYQVGSGQQASFSNPLMTESQLETIYSNMQGINYYGAKFSLNWNSELFSGQFIRIMTDEEYKNYLMLMNSIENTTDETELLSLKSNVNSVGTTVMITNQTITFNGGKATSVIDSLCSTETSKELLTPSPTITKIIEAGKHATNYITEAEDGALVIARDTDDYKVRIDADSLDVINGDTTVATFGESTIIGDSTSSTVLNLTNKSINLGYLNNDTNEMDINLFDVGYDTTLSILVEEDLYNFGFYIKQFSVIGAPTTWVKTTYAINTITKLEIVANGTNYDILKYWDEATATGYITSISNNFKINITNLPVAKADIDHFYIEYSGYKINADVNGNLNVKGSVDITSDLSLVGNFDYSFGDVTNGEGYLKLGNNIYMEYGNVTCKATKVTTNQDFTVTFPKEFETVPNIQLTNQNIPGNYHFHMSVAGASTTGFNIRLRSYEGAAHTYTIYWQAVGR